MGLMRRFRRLFSVFHSNDSYYRHYKFIAARDLSGIGIYRMLKEKVGRPRHGILDFGCGVGYLCKYLGAEGVDINPFAVAVARQVHPQGKFHVKNLAQMARWRRFGAVTCVNMLEHLEDAELENFFEILPRLLDRRGRLYVVYDNMYHPLQLLSGLLKPGMLLTDPTHVHCWTPSQFRRLLEKHLVVEEEHGGNIQAQLLPLTNHFSTAYLFVCRPRRSA